MVIVVPLLLLAALVAAFALAPSVTPPPRRPTTEPVLPPAGSSGPAPTPNVSSRQRASPTFPVKRRTLAVDPDDLPPRGSPLRGMLAGARRFADAYLRYEIGRLSRRVRRAIAATCTPAFARYLLARPAHLAGPSSAHPRDVEVDRVVSVGFAGGQRIEVSFVAEHDSADTGAFLVTLTRNVRRWLVASMEL
jgi:hypothetical protein